jgi:uncharacterized protein YndB with AHSA1/START domain
MIPPGTVKITTPSDREIVVTRVVDAPRRLVFDAMNRPEHLKQWLLGPPGWEMVACENDPKPGGKFRYAWRNTDGSEMAMSGVYREVVAPERIVRTERFEMGCDHQSGEQLGTMVLTESNGRTTITITVLFPTKEARDGLLASGMEAGMNASYARLDEVVKSLRSAGPAKGAREA